MKVRGQPVCCQLPARPCGSCSQNLKSDMKVRDQPVNVVGFEMVTHFFKHFHSVIHLIIIYYSVAEPHLLLCGSRSGSRIQKMSIWIWIRIHILGVKRLKKKNCTKKISTKSFKMTLKNHLKLINKT